MFHKRTEEAFLSLNQKCYYVFMIPSDKNKRVLFILAVILLVVGLFLGWLDNGPR